jgi:hypothetical protein
MAAAWNDITQQRPHLEGCKPAGAEHRAVQVQAVEANDRGRGLALVRNSAAARCDPSGRSLMTMRTASPKGLSSAHSISAPTSGGRCETTTYCTMLLTPEKRRARAPGERTACAGRRDSSLPTGIIPRPNHASRPAQLITEKAFYFMFTDGSSALPILLAHRRDTHNFKKEAINGRPESWRQSGRESGWR